MRQIHVSHELGRYRWTLCHPRIRSVQGIFIETKCFCESQMAFPFELQYASMHAFPGNEVGDEDIGNTQSLHPIVKLPVSLVIFYPKSRLSHNKIMILCNIFSIFEVKSS